MTTYNVTAKRWAHGWELHIDGVGVTQSRALGRAADRMVRDYIALDRGDDEARDATIAISAHVDGLDDEAAEVREMTRQLVRMQDEVARRSRHLVAELRGRGLSGNDMATVLGISPQRVSQLAPAAKTSRTTSTKSGRVSKRSRVKTKS